MTELLSAISRSLLISCMIPAIVFVTVTMIIFAPMLPTHLLTQLNVIEKPLTPVSPVPTPSALTPPTYTVTPSTSVPQQTPTSVAIDQQAESTRLADFASVLAIILVLSFLFAYFLMIMNWIVVRFYEGYYFIPFRQWFKDRQSQRKQELVKRRDVEKRKLLGYSTNPDLHQDQWRVYVGIQDRLVSEFPKRARDMLPSRLGNIYRALEDYSFRRYGMDGIFFWPRLAKVIPVDYADKIVDQNNAITFLLNSSLISALIGMELIYLLIRMRTLDWRISGIPVCVALFYIFYYGATSVASTLGHYVRTSYDFFRLELLKELHIDPPSRLGGREEKALWQSVHEFLVLGQDFPYHLQTQTFPSTKLISTAVQLIYAWITLAFWTSINHILERLLLPPDSTRVETPVVGR